MSAINNHSSIKDAIYSAILEDILSNEYLAGDVLNEKALVEKYGYSKTPIREALLSLCNDGVLRNIPRYGYEIIRLTTDDIRDMLQFRYFLESGILSLNYDNFTSLQIERLYEIDEKCTLSENEIWAHWDWNTQFHVKMMAFCKNDYAVEELRRCMDRLKRAYAQLYWNSPETVSLDMDTRNHSVILNALKEKDLTMLLNALKNDIRNFGGPNCPNILL